MRCKNKWMLVNGVSHVAELGKAKTFYPQKYFSFSNSEKNDKMSVGKKKCFWGLKFKIKSAKKGLKKHV